MADTFTITDLAGEFNVTPRAIRFYEDKKLLRPVRQGLNRVYSRRDRARLMLILRGKRLGFSLSEIREMLDLYDLGDGQVEQLRMTLKRSRERLTVLESQRRDINEAIRGLKADIDCMAEYLDRESDGKSRQSLASFIAEWKQRTNQLVDAAD
jgi:DNA-binding transcriptional MerR regulator